MTFYLDLDALFWPGIILGSVILWLVIARIISSIIKCNESEGGIVFIVSLLFPLFILPIVLILLMFLLYYIVMGEFPDIEHDEIAFVFVVISIIASIGIYIGYLVAIRDFDTFNPIEILQEMSKPQQKHNLLIRTP